MVDKKVVVIGLDGGDFNFITQGISENLLPTFKRIMEKGSFGKLRSVIQPITAPAWASFLTGKNPGKHGIFDFYVRKKASYSRRPANGGDVGRTFYEVLSDYGKNVGLINVPLTYPPRKVNGFIVSGMMTPPGKSYTYPPELQAELDSMGYEIEVDEAYTPGKEDRYIKIIERLIEKRKIALFTLMDGYSWDFLICLFRETDLISHAFWKFQDSTHSMFHKRESEKYGNVILWVYQKMDEILNEVIRRMDKNTVLIVISDHGFGPELKMIHLNTWLVQQGYLEFKRNVETSIKKFLFHHGLTPNRLWSFLIKKRFFYRHIIKDLNTRNRMAERFLLSYTDVDWARTSAYAFGSVGSWGLIFINKKDREPRGIVPEQQYEKLRRELAGKIVQLEDPEDKKKIVDAVYMKEDVYWGNYVEEAPDMIIKWKDGYITYPFFGGGGKIITEGSQARSGNHRMDGIFFAYGGGIAKERTIVDAEIIDIPPTILHILDVPIPKDMDGRVLMEIFKENSYFAKKEITYEKNNHEKELIKKIVKKLVKSGKI